MGKAAALKRQLATGLLLLAGHVLAGCAVGAAHPDEAFDLVIQNGLVIDGTGAPGFRADVAISGDRIARVDTAGIPELTARDLIDASSRVVSPGFIDHHAHVQAAMHRRPLAENFVRQGITTILASLHSHDQPWPFGEYLDALEMAPNVGFFAGHNWIRRRVMGTADRAPTEAELERMRELVDQSMREGALGLATGLRYIPGQYAGTEEVIELARVAGRHGGIYVSHIRDEGPGVVEAVAEVIRIVAEAGLPSQVQHHKAMGNAQWGLTETTLAMIDEARAAGLDITLDVYPYTATSTGSGVLFPAWAHAGGADSLRARLRDSELRPRLEAEIRERILLERGGGDLRNIQFREIAALPEYEGQTMADMAADRGLPNDVETGVRLAIELQLAGGFSGIWHVIDDADVKRIMRHPAAMFCTDGNPVDHGIGHPHPRSYGAFPRVLGRYVRELGVLELPEAIHRMTELSARQIGELERGVIREGSYADITIFDPQTIRDRGTFTDPHQFPVGIEHVLVNGVPVIRDRSLTGRKPGRVLRGPSRP